MGPIDPPGNCSVVGSRTLENTGDSSPDHFISGFKIEISHDQITTPGVFAMAPVYASIGEHCCFL